MRRNKNVTLDQLRAALIQADGSRSVAARTLDISLAWIGEMIRTYEARGEKFPQTKRRRQAERKDLWVPSPEEMDQRRNELRASMGLPAAEYKHDPLPTQAELDWAAGDFGDGA